MAERLSHKLDWSMDGKHHERFHELFMKINELGYHSRCRKNEYLERFYSALKEFYISIRPPLLMHNEMRKKMGKMAAMFKEAQDLLDAWHIECGKNPKAEDAFQKDLFMKLENIEMLLFEFSHKVGLGLRMVPIYSQKTRLEKALKVKR